ncbi:hypothetical protein TSUD_381350 [Trifolium subterraneum]|uniref:Major facilitator superfamily (MFS) profile domain-containing protein n=1 Tax=Trifolium subterraneum TaxID=3900 RepID=A0A2Z6MD05_TRISU|nr:hypothetical protein TSUD_381350 [Trifolium subterraneum]
MAIEDVESGENNGVKYLQEPFIQQSGEDYFSDECKEVDSYKSVENGSIGMVLLSTFVAVCGSFSFGTCVGYSAPTQSAIRADLNLSLAEFSMFGSLVTIGAMLGAITSGRITDFIGRKGAMRISTGFCIIGWLAVFFSKSSYTLDLGRFSTGYGIGVISYVCMFCFTFVSGSGIYSGNSAKKFTRWTCNDKSAYDCYWIISVIFNRKCHKLETTSISRKLRGNDVDISHEATEILDNIETLQSLPKTKFLDLFQSKYVRSVVDQSLFLEWVPTLAVAGVLIYIAAFSIGLGSVPWVMMSEVFPINVKGTAGSLVVLVAWLGAWIVSYTFNFLMSWSSPGTMFLYAGCSLLTIVFVSKVVPETKGKTLEEIQACISS